MQWSLSPKLTEVTVAAVSLQEAKDHLLIRDSRHDSRIAAKLLQATAFCQGWQGRQYLTATFAQKSPSWPSRIVLHAAPVVALTSVTYLDVNDASQTLAATNYTLSKVNGLGVIEWTSDSSLPTLTSDDRQDKVTANFTAGYGTTTDSVPPLIRAAILFMTEHLFEQTSPAVIGTAVNELPFGIASILDMEKVHYPEMAP